MAKFRKRIMLETRDYHSPDGVLAINPDRVRHWESTFAKFRAANLGIPIGWGHSDDPAKSQPIQMATADGQRRRLPQDIVGYLDSFKADPDGRGAEIVLDIRRKEDAEKVRHNLAHVSPVIFDRFVDGKGTEHEDAITHVDLVAHPVDETQTDFEPMATAFAIRLALDGGKRFQTFAMAKDDDMPEENNQTNEVAEESVENADGRLKKVMEALGKMQIVLSDDTNEENFLEHLEQALLTVDAMNNGTDLTEETGDLEVAEPDLAMLSLDQERQKKFIDKQHRTGLTKRLSSLAETGRCTPAEVKRHTPSIKAVRLSLDDNGDPVPSALESWIESRESVPAGTFWDAEQRTRLSAMSVVPQPDDVSGDRVSEEEADQIVDEMFGVAR